MKRLILALSITLTAWLSHAQTPYLVKAGITLYSNQVLINGTIYFSAYDGTNGIELWKSDGSEAGTVMVKDIYPGSSDSNPKELINVNNILYFTANNGTNGYELWKSDGTEAGTVMVMDINPGSGSSAPSSLTNIDDMLICFYANDGTGNKLWFSYGTPTQTGEVRSGSPSAIFFDLFSLANSRGPNYYYSHDDGTNGNELWRKDAQTGTVMVKDIRPGDVGSNPTNFVDVNGTLYFSADNGVNGIELWQSDGTEAGTVMVKDINLDDDGEGNSNPKYLTNVNGVLYFSAHNGTDGYELWKSDGTEAGTVMVMDINPRTYSGSDPSYLTNINGILYFQANDGTGNGLWALNTNEGTLPVSLLNFTATAKSNGAVLTWQTATESNNSHFVIKRSTNGANFTEIGKVASRTERKDGQLSISTPNAYTFTDKTPANGTNYYQLLQIDNDGKTTDLGVRTLNFGLSTSDIRLYPNPVTDKIYIGNARVGAVYTIYNNVGKKSAYGAITGGINQINVSALPQGIYLINVDGKTMKFVKE